MMTEPFEDRFDALIRLAAELEQIAEKDGVVRMQCHYHNKHGGPDPTVDEPNYFDVRSLAWQVRDALARLRDVDGFTTIAREIIGSDDG